MWAGGLAILASLVKGVGQDPPRYDTRSQNSNLDRAPRGEVYDRRGRREKQKIKQKEKREGVVLLLVQFGKTGSGSEYYIDSLGVTGLVCKGNHLLLNYSLPIDGPVN